MLFFIFSRKKCRNQNCSYELKFLPIVCMDSHFPIFWVTFVTSYFGNQCVFPWILLVLNILPYTFWPLAQLILRRLFITCPCFWLGVVLNLNTQFIAVPHNVSRLQILLLFRSSLHFVISFLVHISLNLTRETTCYVLVIETSGLRTLELLCMWDNKSFPATQRSRNTSDK